MAVREMNIKPRALERLIMLGMLILTIAGILTAITIYDYQKEVSKIIDETPRPEAATRAQYDYFNYIANYNQLVTMVQSQSFSVALITIIGIILFLQVIAFLINSLMLIRMYEILLDVYEQLKEKNAALTIETPAKEKVSGSSKKKGKD
ncbi:MAG: hypothetical protein QF415_11255 [Candidatus Undinarchaeales archaeon]|nr:hypothetical protein [Candidatus Undinarchaeales archaeon]MDP7492817.1 hypothetical protein [Candidatus Undinarchaeales archaeon]